jgi:hypothetical protein
MENMMRFLCISRVPAATYAFYDASGRRKESRVAARPPLKPAPMSPGDDSLIRVAEYMPR